MKFLIRVAAPLTIVMSFALNAQAQAQFGYGMYGGMQACPYNYGSASGAVSEDDTIKDINDAIKELQKQRKAKQSELSKIDNYRTGISGTRKTINEFLSPDYAQFVIDHMEGGKDCKEYIGVGDAEATMSQGEKGGQGVQNPASLTTKPFEASKWGRICDANKPGYVSGGVCEDSTYRNAEKTTVTVRQCKEAVLLYKQQFDKKERLKTEVAALDRAIQDQRDRLSDERTRIAEERREEQRQRLEGGICEGCAMRGNGYTYQKPETDWVATGLSAVGNIALGALFQGDRKSTRLNSSHTDISRMPSSA